MADFPVSATSGAGRRNRRSPRIDFTPMVDLGFLLITFFMLTTTLHKPNVMPLVMPDSDGRPEPTRASRSLTLLLGSENRVFWYEGLPDTLHLQETGFDVDGVRAVVLDKMRRLEQQSGLQSYKDAKTGDLKQGSYLNVVIKPCPDSRYENLVDALDEMNICHVRFYCIVNPLPLELEQMR